MMTNGRQNSIVLAGIIAAGVTLWFASGALGIGDGEGSADDTRTAAPDASRAITVTVQQIEAENVTDEVRLQGHTAPNRKVTIRAETAGRVAGLLVDRGGRVVAGQPVVRLAMEDRKAQRRKAAALLEQRERDYDRIRKLADDGHLAGTRVDEAHANLEAARAELAHIDEEISKTTLVAPFPGILNDRAIELGDYVAVRDPVFTVVDDHPLIVAAAVAQRDKGAIRVGSATTVKLITGQELSGKVRYLSAVADPETRTFAIEVEIPNADGELPTGVSAEAIVPAGTTRAHRLSPGWLVRTGDDRFGVYTIDDGMHAAFARIDIVRANSEAIWVSGLPETTFVVSAGQGFLSDGQPVRLDADDPAARKLSMAGGNATAGKNRAQPQ